jgi:hypothetical protein
MKRFLAILALLPTPALADMTCTFERQCGGGTCEPFSGGPMVLHAEGDAWQISLDGSVWAGQELTSVAGSEELHIVVPPQDGMAGLISVYPTGEVSFTAHAFFETALAITGAGTCMTEGG